MTTLYFRVHPRVEIFLRDILIFFISYYKKLFKIHVCVARAFLLVLIKVREIKPKQAII